MGVKPSVDVARIPQRFEWKNSHDDLWSYGVCIPMKYLKTEWWSIQAGASTASFEDDPWEAMGQVIGDAVAFKWLDEDYEWEPSNGES